jgi:hypothetical protein
MSVKTPILTTSSLNLPCCALISDVALVKAVATAIAINFLFIGVS